MTKESYNFGIDTEAKRLYTKTSGMNVKRFYLMNVEDPLHEYGRWCKAVLEDGKTGRQYEDALEVMDLLNELHEENQHYKHILQDLGLLMTDEEVIDIRIEMAEKILKPLLKRNGFNVDVDCEHGFKIIPKGDME